MATCECSKLPALADIEMGKHEPVFRLFGEELRHPDPLWWLAAHNCTGCGQWWLVAADERVNDVFLLRRLTDSELRSLRHNGVWPDDFKRYADVLRIGNELGHRWVFGDPESPSLIYTVIDLAHEEEGIKTSKIASLLQIDHAQARRIVELAQHQEPLQITHD